MFYLSMISLFFIIIMTLLGIIVIDYFDLKQLGIRYASPVGMVAFIGSLQILYYPFQFLEKSSTIIHLITIVLSLIVLMVSIVKRERVISYLRDCLDHKIELLIGIILFVLFCVLYSNVEFIFRTEDSNFYITYVANNVYTSQIGSNTNVLYKFQGIYNFYSTFVYLYHRLSFLPGYFHLLPLGIISWGPSFVFFWIFPFFLMNIYEIIVKIASIDKSVWYKLVFVGVSVFSLFMYWYLVHPYYGNTYRRITVVYLMLSLFLYYRNSTWKNTYLVILFLFSFISQTSTGFFLGAMLIYALMIMFAYEKRSKYLLHFAFMCLPLAIYMMPLKPMTIPIVVLGYIFVFLVNIMKFEDKITSLLNKLLVFLSFSLPVLFFLLPQIGVYTPNLQYSSIFREHSFDQVYGYLRFDQGIVCIVFNIVCWSTLFAFVYFTKNKIHKLHYFGTSSLIILVTFFNPLVCQFVSDNITDLVYFRIYDIIFNPLTHILFVIVFIQKYKHSKLLTMSIAALFLISGIYVGSQNIDKYIANSEINTYYHSRNEEIEVLQTLRQKMYIDDPNRTIVVASHIYGTELLADYPIKNVVNNRVDNIDLLFSKSDDESVFQQIFYRKLHDDPRYETDNLRACELARKNNVEYTILDRQYNYQMEDGLGYCGEILFEENGYRVYIMRYDWILEEE